MTPTDRKRAERQRRKEAGEVRVECWLSPRETATLDWFCARERMSRNDGLKCLVELGAVVAEMAA